MDNQFEENMQNAKEGLSQLSLDQLQRMSEAIQDAINAKKSEPRAPKVPTVHAEFEHEDTKYGIVIPQFRLDNILYKASEAAANPELCAKLVTLAKEGPEGPRDEESFDENGLLKIMY